MNEQSQFLTPFQRKSLLKRLKTELRPEYRRRIQIMLLADAGQSQTQICEQLECCQETVRQWVKLAREGKAHLWSNSPIGRPQVVNDQYLDRLKKLVMHSPRAHGYPFERWTAKWLSKHLMNELGIEVSDRHINRLLKKMGLSTRSCHPTAATELPETKQFEIAIHDLQPTASSDLLLINPIEVRS